MPSHHQQHFTVGSIAERLNEPFSRIAYLIASRRIAPTSRVGIVRLFDEHAVEQLRDEITKIDKKRSGENRSK